MFSGRNPDKLEAKAAQYEQKGKTAKALKYREKAARIRGQNLPAGTAGTAGTTTTTVTTVQQRTPQRYEQNALKWEQRGNLTKAQKNREKVWRLQNPQYATSAAPTFYNQNQFLGYNQQVQQQTTFQQQGATTHQVLAATVETHMHPTIVQQTSRPERIVEVQPVIHRQVDAPQVHLIEKHLYETVPSTGPGIITNQPIVEEIVRPRVIEEIQPVVHREVPAPFVEHVEQHVTEHITQPTTMTKEVINDATIRTAPIGLAAGGPLQQQPGFQQQSGLQQQQPGLQQQNLQQQNLQQQNTAGRNNNNSGRRI